MIGIDIETTSFDPADGRISLIQVYDPEDGAVWMHDLILGGPPEDVPTRGVAHNAVFEERWLREYGYDPRLEDTMIASQVFYTGTNAARNRNLSHKLSAVVARELKRELSKDEQTSDWEHRPLTREQLLYAARDAAVLPELYDRLMAKVQKAGLRAVYDLEVRVGRAVDQMERNGFAINVAKLDPLVEEVTETAERLKAELETDWDINPGSSKQLREYFRLDEREEWPRTPAGAPSTNQDALRALVDEDPSVAKWVEWKRVEKLRSTYGKSLQKHIVDGRIHARFNPFGAGTGRFSSSNPNLQNIPKDKRLRSLFWSGAEDRMLVKADYAGIELWLAAVLWGENRMQRLLAEGTNLHTATAASIYGKPVEAISKDGIERHVGKTANFALLYGAGPGRLHDQLHKDGVQVTKEEAEEHFHKFLSTYKAFNRKRQLMRSAFDAGRLKEARTAIGRRRCDKTEWHGPYMNHEIQGTAAGGLKYAIARFHEGDRHPTAKLVAVVHDEMVVEADEGEGEAVREWVEECMVEGMLDAVADYRDEVPSLPKVEAKVSRVWEK